MPTPFPTALSDRLAHGAWRDALPPHGAPLNKARPFQVRGGASDSQGLRPLVETSQKVLQVLLPTLIVDAGPGDAPVPLREVHAFLDRLDTWVATYSDHLTWPASQQGWVNAVRATVEANDRDGLATVLGAFPSQVRGALKDVTLTGPDVNPLGAWWKAQVGAWGSTPVTDVPVTATTAMPPTVTASPAETPAPSTVPSSTQVKASMPPIPAMDDLFKDAPASPSPLVEASPTPVESTAPAIAPLSTAPARPTATERSTPTAPTETVEKSERPMRSAHWSASPETVDWLKTVFVRLRQNPGQSMGVKQEWLDEQVKQRANQSKNWFEEQLFPALAGLSEQDLGCLLDHWPAHRRLTVSNPVEMVSQPRFWSILKVQDPVRTQLYEQALPRMLSMDRVSFDERYTMAQHMLEWASRSPDLFRQRLELWVGWGGSVTEEEVPLAPVDGDVFNAAPVARRSVARWILEQGNDMWASQLNELAGQHGWTLPKDVVPAPATTPEEKAPAPRRFRPR